jgi:hypothetical protein
MLEQILELFVKYAYQPLMQCVGEGQNAHIRCTGCHLALTECKGSSCEVEKLRRIITYLDDSESISLLSKWHLRTTIGYFHNLYYCLDCRAFAKTQNGIVHNHCCEVVALNKLQTNISNILE